MRRLSHREYLTRLAWLDEQWNQPDRNDNYLMQVAAEVRKVLNLLRVFWSKKQPDAVQVDDLRIKFVEKKTEKPAATSKPDVKEAARRSKARWFGRLGIGRKKGDGC